MWWSTFRPPQNTAHAALRGLLLLRRLYNFSNPTNVIVNGVLAPSKESQFVRNQFGGDGGGAVKKDKTFVFLSYEALRQRQAVPLSSTTLSAAQVAQAQASSDQFVKALLPLIPTANEGTRQYAFSMSAPVNIQQGTVNFCQVFSENQRFTA